MEPISVVDMHTGGEPVRIVTGGYSPIPGRSILEKRAYVRDKLDHLRRLLMFEPRGHADMYGALLVPTSLPGADLAVLFMHNEGYSTMCGHAVIALGRYAVDHGLVMAVEPLTRVAIECPCGLVVATVEVENGKAGAVAFESVPAFLFQADLEFELPAYGRIPCDIAYGGAFYAIAAAESFGIGFGRSPVRAFVDAAVALTETIKQSVPLAHPDSTELAYLYGAILTDGGTGTDRATRNVCIFADAQVDRSPTGSGVTARMAALHAKGSVARGETRAFESIVGSRFTGEVVRQTVCGDHHAVTVRVCGRAHYCGTAQFRLEADDEIGGGFLLR